MSNSAELTVRFIGQRFQVTRGNMHASRVHIESSDPKLNFIFKYITLSFRLVSKNIRIKIYKKHNFICCFICVSNLLSYTIE
jgi:hypothetical protein